MNSGCFGVAFGATRRLFGDSERPTPPAGTPAPALILYIYGFSSFLSQIRKPYVLSPVCRPVISGVYCLVLMEQMMATLLLALKEVETENPDGKARETLQRAVDQAIRMRERWSSNWKLQN